MYQEFAKIYDHLMMDVDYQSWVEYIKRLFSYYNIKPKEILELGCGTGNITIPLALDKYNMTGIDLSQDMLSIAEQKARDKGLKINWFCQDMENLEGFRNLEAIICVCDGINYILKDSQLFNVFKNVYNSLDYGGLFAFDLNSKYKIEKILSEKTFAYPGDEVSYIWENYYNKKTEIICFELSFFIKDNGNYKRFNETHRQKAYSIDHIVSILEKAGFKEIDYFSAFTLEKPCFSSERIQYIAIK